MSVQVLIAIFSVVYFCNNIFYISLMEGIFDIKNNKIKTTLFCTLATASGVFMLVDFGSMSALGYFIALIVYTIIVFVFYPKQHIMTKVACILYYTLHIMVARAIISSTYALVTGKTIYELCQNPMSFWIILIYTSIMCTLFITILLHVVPRKYLRIISNKTEALALYLAVLVIANIYMIANGNVYIHEIKYFLLPSHQILAAFAWLFISYVGIYMLVGFDMLREHRNSLAQNIIYKHVIENRSLSVVEVNCSKNAIIRITKNGKNEALPDISYSEYSSNSLQSLVYHEDFDKALYHESVENIINEFNLGHSQISFDERIVLSDDSIRWVRSIINTNQNAETGDIISIISIMDDIHELKENELSLTRKAQLDPLLEIYNKKATESLIKKHLSSNRSGVLIMIDLDNFKAINDNFGHKYGDDVLKEVAEKIGENFRADDIVGRIGGDEFIVFLKTNIGTKGITRKASSLCTSIKKEYTQNGVTVGISCSIGIAVAPEYGRTFSELYEKADAAMYICKKNTKDGFIIYNNLNK